MRMTPPSPDAMTSRETAEPGPVSFKRSPLVPVALGAVFVTTGAADGNALIAADLGADWLFLVRSACEILGGLWLLSGLAPRLARIVLMAVFAEIFLCDLVNALATPSTFQGFDQIVPETWWTLGGDLAIVLALGSWRPAAGRRAWDGPRRGWLVATGLGAAALGVATDRAGVIRFPTVATASSPRPGGRAGLDYLVYLPPNYDRSAGPWPLIVALHGSGSTGHDLALVRSEGLPRYVEEQGGIPFLVIAPQSPRGWKIVALDALLDEVLARYRVDTGRVYLTGLSMGGHGTWAWAAARPNRFAAIAPICGWGDPARAGRLREVPVWAFHGAADAVVPPDRSRAMVEALRAAGGDAILTIYPGVGHDAWTAAYADPRLYAWLRGHRRPASP